MLISIHAPAKGATIPHGPVWSAPYVFQSTLPRRERQYLPCGLLYYPGYFNPRSREGSDDYLHVHRSTIYRISIHAPAKGATILGFLQDRAKDISIHAPAKGATCCFPLFLTPCVISIHAPAKGATYEVAVFSDIDAQFQSTLPRRERRGSSIKQQYGKCISIHAPAKGATTLVKSLFQKITISIHAPAKGATAFINIFSLTVRLFLFHLNNKI